MRRDTASPRVPLYIPALLISASIVSILSTDLYTPSLPHLSRIFGREPAEVQLTMSLNLLGFAVAQLVYGPLSERVGRRPVLLGGMIGFAIASLGCALAWSLDSLIAARVLQGVTAGAEAVIALAMIRELYDEASAVRVLGLYGMAIALAPAVGPAIGGQMHVWFGWRSNFYLLAALIVLVVLLLWRFLPETLANPDKQALRPSRLLRGYGALLFKRRFMTYGGILAITLGGLFAFVTEAPFVYIAYMRVAADVYGTYYAAVVLAYFFGSLAVTRLAVSANVDALLCAGLLLCVAGGLGMLWLGAGGRETPLAVTAVISLYTFGLGLVFATAPVRALDYDDDTQGHGYGAALLCTLEIGGGGLGAYAVGLLHDGTGWALGVALSAFTLLAFGLFMAGRPWRRATTAAAPP